MNPTNGAFELTPEEEEIENSAEQTVSVGPEKRERVEKILETARKSRAISLRLSEHDLEMTKLRASREGVPYQTLISSIIHKYVTDQLVETDEIRKAIGRSVGKDAM
jgi:predicted DNA binding CopG/RHH family protein